MKKILLSVICFFAVLSLALANQGITPFPNVKKGINIMPLGDMKLPDAMSKQMLSHMKIMAAAGYINTTESDQDVIALLSMQKNSMEELKQFDNDESPLDTHLRSSISKLHLAFNFKGIPGVQNDNVIGFAAAGGYTEEKGWDGVVEFVSIPKMGVCSFTTYRIESVVLDKETLEYLVNQKPSNKNISGNWNTGFLYTLNWYNPDRLMRLQCANKVLKTETLSQMIMIAKKIDFTFN